MLKPIEWKTVSQAARSLYLKRPVQLKEKKYLSDLQLILDSIKKEGDVAVRRYTKQWDGCDLLSFEVTESEFEKAYEQVDNKTLNAIDKVIDQIEKFHQLQYPIGYSVETVPGVFCEWIPRALRCVGLYVPAGTAPLISTVMMLAIPARIAGCEQRILCSPPRSKNNSIDPAILVAAKRCGIHRVFKVGGAQAIAAMAYGTETIPKVDKIFGPGNNWVTQAKLLVAIDSMGAVYDMPAGPSELLIIADRNADPNFIAADILSQAEHGSDSQIIFIATDLLLIDLVNKALIKQIAVLPRKDIASSALNNAVNIIVESVDEAIKIANDYAPEHLILQVDDPRQYLSAIRSAGSVFLGKWSPETAGDYASGTNHVLPTNGYARSLSGLSVNDFMKMIAVQTLTKKGLTDLADTIRVLTNIEGLSAHQRAIDIRLCRGDR